MQKINIIHILRGHTASLTVNGENKISWWDFFVFYILPTLFAAIGYLLNNCFDSDVYSLSINIFAIFAALLLSVQVALFGISQKKWNPPVDPKKLKLFNDTLAQKKNLLLQLNTNISYLVILCISFVSIFLIFYSFKINYNIEGFISIYIYIHFLLTTIMIVKRSHALFEKEYELDKLTTA